MRGPVKAFGGIHAVDDVSFALAAGEMLALIGPNGAGKTTCFNMVGGQLAPDAGSVRLGGVELVGLRPEAIWRQGVGRTFQIAETFASLTVVENVQMALLSHAGRVRGFWTPARAQFRDEAIALLESVGMAAQAERATSVLAYGDVKRVELAMALAHRPRLLLMDEPTAGMAPRERNELMALARRPGARAVDRRALHRAQHGRGVRPCRPDHRPGPRRADRRRPAGGGARRRPGARGLLRRRHDLRRTATSRAAEAMPSQQTRRMLEVAPLDAWYGQAQILYGVSLAVGAGECVALVGRNGAGKSTTMKAIMGLIAKKRGHVAFRGHDISALAGLPHRPARPRLGAGGPAHLHRPHGAREPRGRPPAEARGRARVDAGASSTRCSRTSARCPTGPAAA